MACVRGADDAVDVGEHLVVVAAGRSAAIVGVLGDGVGVVAAVALGVARPATARGPSAGRGPSRDRRMPQLQRLGEQHLLAGRGVRDEALRDLQVGVADEDRVDAGHLLGQQRRWRSRGRAARRRRTTRCRRRSGTTTMTTSAPAALSRGTMTLACSTMPGNFTLPSTLALSQIATPGVTRPRMPTLIGLRAGTLTVLMTHGLKTGAPVFQSTELAPSSGKSSCFSNARSVSRP